MGRQTSHQPSSQDLDRWVEETLPTILPPLRNVIRSAVAAEDRDDCLQEALLRLFRHAGESIENWPAYATVVAQNACRSWRRRCPPRRVLGEGDSLAERAIPEAEGGQLSAGDFAYAKLTPFQQEVLACLIREEHNIHEIARQLGRQRHDIRRAIRAIAKRLRKEK
jgi:DNA-directed RNA polymerase specialized sigma24 family protein